MAAGEGARLRPLTERWPKPVLPIDGRPVIATLLRELAAAGCELAVVVTGHLAEQVEELVGDGSAFGLEVRFARQPGVLGSADAVQRGVAAGASRRFSSPPPTPSTRRGDVGRFAEAFATASAAGAIAVRRASPGAPQPVARRGGLVEKLLDDDAANPLSAAPLWAFGPELVPLLDGLAGPALRARRRASSARSTPASQIAGNRDRPDTGLDGSG